MPESSEPSPTSAPPSAAPCPASVAAFRQNAVSGKNTESVRRSADTPLRRGSWLAIGLLGAAASLLLPSAIGDHPAVRFTADAGVILLACVGGAVALARTIPWQNVVAVTLATLATSSAALAVPGSEIGEGIKRMCPNRAGGLVCGAGLWASFWIATLLSARGTAEWTLRSRYSSRNWGWQLIGLTTGLMTIPAMLWHGLAVHGRGYWHWNWPMLNPPVAGVVLTVGWLMLSVLVQLAATPWLINKRPGPRSVSWLPLGYWLLLSLWLSLANVMHGPGWQ